MEFPTLFAKSKTGKIKQWIVSVEDNIITVMYGQVGGKQTPQITPILEGKNIGKSNETTPHEQACSEARSKWNKQIKSDYRERVEDIPTSTLPPLAHKFQERGEALGSSYDVLCKLNGVRCTMFYNGGDVIFQSRGGERYPVIQEIADELYEKVWQHEPTMVIDNELYCHGMFLEDITGAVKKTKKDTAKIQCYVFDMFLPSSPKMPWVARYMMYRDYIRNDKGNRVFSVLAELVESEKEMKWIHNEFVAGGYEGVVCRKLGGSFVFGHRTSDFQKYKVPIDKEFKVVRIDTDKNGCAVPWCTIGENENYPKKTEFKAPLIGTHEYQQGIAQNAEEYIGKHLKVVFESYTKYGLPGKPKGHVFRKLDEDGSPLE